MMQKKPHGTTWQNTWEGHVASSYLSENTASSIQKLIGYAVQGIPVIASYADDHTRRQLLELNNVKQVVTTVLQRVLLLEFKKKPLLMSPHCWSTNRPTSLCEDGTQDMAHWRIYVLAVSKRRVLQAVNQTEQPTSGHGASWGKE
jgi:hypothetical protein